MALPFFFFLKDSFPFRKEKGIPAWRTVAVKLLLCLVSGLILTVTSNTWSSCQVWVRPDCNGI